MSEQVLIDESSNSKQEGLRKVPETCLSCCTNRNFVMLPLVILSYSESIMSEKHLRKEIMYRVCSIL